MMILFITSIVGFELYIVCGSSSTILILGIVIVVGCFVSAGFVLTSILTVACLQKNATGAVVFNPNVVFNSVF